jgi:pimeloyl-ACP methyl ester carboxylesterase
MAADLHHLVHAELGIQGPISVVGHDLGSMLGFAYALRYRDDVVSLTTMKAPLPGTDYYEQRKVAKSAWHFDFHANPDIAVYLTNAAHGKLTVPLLASGGGAQTLAANYAPMCEEVAANVTGHLVPDAGHWIPEENPDGFTRMFLDFDRAARAASQVPLA